MWIHAFSLRVWAWSITQTAASRFWTWLTNFIFLRLSQLPKPTPHYEHQWRKQKNKIIEKWWIYRNGKSTLKRFGFLVNLHQDFKMVKNDGKTEIGVLMDFFPSFWIALFFFFLHIEFISIIYFHVNQYKYICRDEPSFAYRLTRNLSCQYFNFTSNNYNCSRNVRTKSVLNWKKVYESRSRYLFIENFEETQGCASPVPSIFFIYQPLHSGRIWHKVNFYAEFNMFEFRVILHLDKLPHQG